MDSSLSPDRCDAIVVGGGIGGLVCAAYLAAEGYRVIVLEQHDVAGGCSQVFRRRRAYEFDVGVHYIGDCGPGGVLPAVLAGLGVGDRISFRPMDPDGFDRITLPSLTVDVPVTWAAYRERLAVAMPQDAAGLTTFVDICAGVGGAMRSSLLAPDDAAAAAAMGRSPLVPRWTTRTLDELFVHCGLSSRARTVLAAQSPNYGAAPARTAVHTYVGMMDHYLRGAYYPEGGGQMIAAALVEALEAHGGELRSRTMVSRILIESGRAAGVELADGRQLRAPLVVSNADYRKTVLELAGAEHFSRQVVARTREATMRLPLMALYLGLDTDLSHRRNANLWWYRDEDIDEVYRRIEHGPLMDEVPLLFVTFASLKSPDQPSLCPPGHSNLQLMTLCPPGHEHWGLSRGPTGGERYRRNPVYQATKARTTEAMLRAGEAALGPLREHIVHIETSTPISHERYTLASGGTPYGMAQWGRSPAFRPDNATSVPGLFVVGQNTRFDSGVVGVAVSGMACAGQILGRRLLSEVHRGAVLGDSSLMPDRAPGWDPLEVSRGAARQGERGLARVDARPRRTAFA